MPEASKKKADPDTATLPADLRHSPAASQNMVRLKFLITRTMEKLGAMNTSFKFRLLDLPNELIAHIVEFISDRNDLRRLACTCRRVQYLAEPVLYRSILLRSGARTERLLNSLIAKSERSSALHLLHVPCDVSFYQSFSAIAGLLVKARNLKELMIESPACNSADFENYERWIRMTDALFAPFQSYQSLKVGERLGQGLEGPSLQKLTKLTLHLNGPRSPYWTVDSRSLNILLHPTLRELKMSCVNILDNITDGVSCKSVTPLKVLTLEECNITHLGLRGLLCLPKALEELYLGENCHNLRHFSFAEIDPKSGYLFARDPAATLAALSQQQDSLKCLVYTTTDVIFTAAHLLRTRNISRGTPVDGGFANFHSLEKVSLIGQCPLFERALISSRSPANLTHLTFACQSPFQSSLCVGDHLAALSDDAALLGYVPFFRAPSPSIPKGLQTLDVIIEKQNPYAPPEWSLMDENKNYIERVAKAASKIGEGVKLRLLLQEWGQYYPPFLYGEREPEAKLVFDGVQYMEEHAWEDVDSDTDSDVSDYEEAGDEESEDDGDA